MTTLGLQKENVRSRVRRNENGETRDKIRKHNQLLQVSQIITSVIHLDALFEVIMDQTNKIMNTERSAVLLYDKKSSNLRSLVATGMESEIRMPSGYGIAGWVFHRNTIVIINDAYNDKRFYAEGDDQSGIRTKSIICVPLVNRKGQCIGSLEALNKRVGSFTDADKELLISISHYAAIAFENSRLYGEVKDYSDKLKSTLIQIETLENVKGQLTKFVPSSVANLVEIDPCKLTQEKMPMDVTILFIDIKGFSRITEESDQRLVNDMVERHFSRYLECINQYGGEVNETTGDGLMVIFNDVPSISHAERAVAASLQIVSENSQLNDDLQYPWGRVELHIGLNSGNAWVGSTKMKSLTGERWTYTASGLVTVLAARIGALSCKNRIYVGLETFKRIKHSYDCEFLGEQKVKNVKYLVPVYWVKESK